jgi:hypothetical protein
LLVAGVLAYLFHFNFFLSILLIGAGIFCIFKWYTEEASFEDSIIDRSWASIAVSRESEAYRVSHIDKEDAIRPAQWFYANPNEFDGKVEFKIKKGKIGIKRFKFLYKKYLRKKKQNY